VIALLPLAVLFFILSIHAQEATPQFPADAKKVQDSEVFAIWDGTWQKGKSSGMQKLDMDQVSVALGVVFLLNAIALVIFPPIGHLLDLSQVQFGLWSALAIHDTSSVVGSTLQYGRQALEVGTTVKLTRALWIVPLTFAVGLAVAHGARPRSGQRPKRPWFILGFLVAAALATYVPVLHSTAGAVSEIARRTLVATLFLIGANLTRDTLRAVGARPLVQGVALWAVVGTGTLGAILAGLVH